MTFERVSTFHGLRLQAGTTTKNSSKKQLQAIGHIPKDKLAYLETAVYMSGENGKRVYVCKRCRNRETRRREAKDRNRKRAQPATSDSDAASPVSKPPRQSLVPPSVDFITAENPDDYDPKRAGQMVEEPSWDPDCADWRHDIVLFNTPAEVKLEDGSCNWLPFRVVCYGKCHGEKVGFRIKFTLRTYDGRILATSITKPIRITDDHKTDTKAKPKPTAIEGPPQPAIARRKARPSVTSVASSRPQSPSLSEAESVQSFQALGEAGAVIQKQTPSVRAGKPYERPIQSAQTSQAPSPMSYVSAQMAGLPSANFFSNGTNGITPSHGPPPQTAHQPTQMSNDLNMSQYIHTVSPHELRGPQFQSPSININSYSVPHSGTPSIASSTAASPRTQMAGIQDDIMKSGFPAGLLESLGLNGPNGNAGSGQGPMLYHARDTDAEMANLISGGFDDLFAGSSKASVSSMDNDQASVSSASVFSGWDDRSSAMFSQSGLPPGTTVVEDMDEDMEKYLDYTGENGVQGDHQRARVAGTFSSPPSGSNFSGLPFDEPFHSSLNSDLHHQIQQQQRQSIPAQSSFPALVPAPAPAPTTPQAPQPAITHVIPGEGPMAGGPTIAIAGQAFQPGMVVAFGQRPAATEFVSSGFMQCKLPPSAFAGVVEVTIQGIGSVAGKMLFSYTDMEKDAMKLALAIQSHYQGSQSDPTYRLAHQVARSSSSQRSHSGSTSPSGQSPGDNLNVNVSANLDVVDTGEDTDSQSSSLDSKSTDDSTNSDLQSTIINFLASIDSHAPGSLRASGAINHTNASQQTLLHIASAMGFSRLVRRLIIGGAQIDVQDTNGYTPLAFAALCGRHTCARVLIEAGAWYDRATNYGEMPLDLAKFGEHSKVERLLLSAVWSTTAEPRETGAVPAVTVGGVGERGSQKANGGSPRSVAASFTSSIDDDNPSSSSEVEDDVTKFRLSSMTPRPRSKLRQSKDKRAMSIKSNRSERHHLPSGSVARAPSNAGETMDDPPPYAPPTDHSRIGVHPAHADDHDSWVKTLASLPHVPHFLPSGVWDHLPSRHSLFGSDKSARTASEHEHGSSSHGWVAFPTPSWETLTKMASPEEVKLFTQAMAAAALNAVVQTGATTPAVRAGPRVRKSNATLRAADTELDMDAEGEGRKKGREDEEGAKNGSKSRRRKSASASGLGAATMVSAKRSDNASPDNVVNHVKRDRMLYLFWLPILLFVGFWLLVSALPIATGFGLIYARKITKAIKGRM